MPDLVKKFGHRAILKFAGTTWMNQALTTEFLDTDFLNTVMGKSLFRQKRLLEWDSFRCHISDATKQDMKQLKVDASS